MAGPPPPAPPDARAGARWAVFPPIALGVIMATLDASVVNIALPTLARTFAAPLVTVEWVALGYSVVLTGLLLAAGRLADLRGRRAVYGRGLALFTLASALCGLAPGIGALIGLRLLQGVGAALVAANGSALLVAAFPLAERGRALGAFGAMVGVGLAVGPPLGGLVIAHASWRWIFLINVPLGALAMALLPRRVPADRVPPGQPAMDVGPPLLWSAGLAGLMLVLSRGPAIGWAHPLVLLLAVLAAAAIVTFLAHERRARAPLLPLDLLVGPLGVAVSLTFLGQLLSVGVGFHLPFYLEEVGGLSAAATGAWLAVLPGAALVCAPIAGRLADAVGARPLLVAGMGLTALGVWLLAQLEARPSPLLLAAGLALVGLGQGLFTVPNASALLSLVPHEKLGFASGLQGTTRNLGIASGLAVTGALVASRYQVHAASALHVGGSGPVDQMAFVAATRDAFSVLTAVALAATALAWAQRLPPRGRASH